MQTRWWCERRSRRSGVVFAWMLVLGLIWSAAAAAQEMVDTSRFKKAPPYVVGYDIYWSGNTWSVQFTEEARYEASKYPQLVRRFITTSSDNDLSKQIANTENLLAQNVDVLIVTPISSTGLREVLEKARQRDIPVVINGTAIKEGYYTSYVNTIDSEFGRIAAEWLVKKLDGKGDILALGGLPGISTTEEVWRGAKEVFARHPGIRVLAFEYANWDFATAKRVTTNLLAAYPKVDAIWADGGNVARGAVEALTEAGRPLVPVTGGGDNGFLKLWWELRDRFDSIAVTKPTYLSGEAVKVALDILQGNPVPRFKVVPPHVVTSLTLAQAVRTDLPDSYWVATRLPEEIVRRLFR